MNKRTTIISIKPEVYIKQLPFVNNDGIYVPVEEYAPEGMASTYKCIMTKEMFVEAYNKWIVNE